MKKKSHKFVTGFTLIELLVVLTIVITVATITGGIFSSTLRSNSKTQISTDLKQRGNYALTSMERMLRNAKDITDCQSDRVSFEYIDGEETTFVCNIVPAGPDVIASNSAANYAVLVEDNINCQYDFKLVCDLPQINIGFTLSENAESPLPFNRSGVNFQTKVTVRNY